MTMDNVIDVIVKQRVGTSDRDETNHYRHEPEGVSI